MMNDNLPCGLGCEVKHAQEVIERYLKLKPRNTAMSYRTVFKQWIAWCDEQDKKAWRPWADTFVKADQGTAMDYFEYLQGRKGLMSRDGRSDRLAPKTLRHRVGALRKLYTWLIQQDVIKGKNPFIFPMPKLANTPTKRPTLAMSAEQTALMLEAFPGNDYQSVMDTAILSVLFGVALRRTEVMTLRVADILTGSREIVLAEQKNQEHDVLPVPSWAWEKLDKFMTRRCAVEPSELVFVKRSGPGCNKNPGIGEQYLKGMFKRACTYAGLPKGYSCHSARASAITQLFDEGWTSRDIQAFARHATRQVTETYDKRSREKLRRLAESLQYKKAS